MPFLTKLVVQFEDGKHWTLTAPLVYVTQRGDTFEIPAGFQTDFASIPQALWSLVGDPGGPWAPAAVVHDFLYRSGIVPRAEADRTFREAMADLGGESAVKRWLMWGALRLAGWKAYQPPR